MTILMPILLPEGAIFFNFFYIQKWKMQKHNELQNEKK